MLQWLQIREMRAQFMLFFRNDYSNGAHPKVLEMLCKTNLELTAGYGADPYCQKAIEIMLLRGGLLDQFQHAYAMHGAVLRAAGSAMIWSCGISGT